MPTRVRHPGAQEFLPDATSLRALRDAARGCRGCDLYRDATQTVFGRGPARSRLVLVGEQPGDVEDVEGKPFVGPAGRVLDDALADAGLVRADVYLTNAVKHFAHVQRGKRRLHKTPTAGQTSACRPWVVAELAAIRPRLVVALGATATKSLLGGDVRVLRDRGRVIERAGGRFLVTIHPSAVLRALPEDRASSYAGLVADLRLAGETIAA
jgi:DNA polymerase